MAQGVRYDEAVNQWLQKGYAVLKPDYQGFGAAGPRVVLDGANNAADIAALVMAAHQLPEVSLAKPWMAIGHSEGGGAVLWLAGLDEPAGDAYPLTGVVAATPTGTGVADILIGASQSNHLPGILQAYVAMTVLSAKAQNDSINLEELVNPSFMPVLEDARIHCMPPPVDKLDGKTYLNAGNDFDKVMAFVEGKSYLPNYELNVPAQIVAGLTDESSVSAELAQEEANKLCEAGSNVQFLTFETDSHDDILPRSFDVALDFEEKTRAGDVSKGCDRTF